MDENNWIDVRCGKSGCNRLLFKVQGLALIETVCPRCRSRNTWPTMDVLVVLKDARIKKVLDKAQLSTAAQVQ